MENVEIEARFLGLDRGEVERKLLGFGAEKVSECFFKEWIFTMDEWRADRRRVRVRTDGEKTFITYKANKTWEVDSTEEVEIVTSSTPEEASKLIMAIGIPEELYQEKKRVRYAFQGISFDLDFLPRVPMILEIEGSSEGEVKRGAELLELDWGEALFLDQREILKEYYDIDLFKETDYRF